MWMWNLEEKGREGRGGEGGETTKREKGLAWALALAGLAWPWAWWWCWVGGGKVNFFFSPFSVG